MHIIVQKFGGTSLSCPEARSSAIRHIEHELEQSHKVVVVVSAMGRKGEPYATDTLLELIEHSGGTLPARERDMLLGCGEMISAALLCSLLVGRGIAAVALTGGQAGIVTNNHHGNARIVSIKPDRIIKLLGDHPVVIVTGFQGITADGDLTTLGRGGSDTSATALGRAIQAKKVDIFTDVSGVFTADPRIVMNARPLHRVSYNEVCQMAQSGAKVIHPRAVEIAMAAHVPLRVRSTFSDDEGTWVGDVHSSDERQVSDLVVTGIACSGSVTQIEVHSQEANFDLHLDVFRMMAEKHISVDFINMNPSGVVYTVYASDETRAVSLLRDRGYEHNVLGGCAKVSVIGGGMNGVPGIMAVIVETLTAKDISILQSADSNTTIWVLVRQTQMAEAVNALHEAFHLGDRVLSR